MNITVYMNNTLHLVKCPVYIFFYGNILYIVENNLRCQIFPIWCSPTVKGSVLFTGLVVLAFIAALLLFSIQNCNSISKREAVRADPTQGLLSYGPIRIEIPNRPHSSKILYLYHCFNDALVKQ